MGRDIGDKEEYRPIANNGELVEVPESSIGLTKATNLAGLLQGFAGIRNKAEGIDYRLKRIMFHLEGRELKEELLKPEHKKEIPIGPLNQLEGVRRESESAVRDCLRSIVNIERMLSVEIRDDKGESTL